MPEDTAIGGRGGAFPSTRWTLILSSRESQDARKAALENLLGTYWKPLYFYVRRKGRQIEVAKDVIQGFYLHLLEHDFLSRLDPSKGRFRSYLRTAVDNYMANLHEQQSAQKRGGGAKTVSLDFDMAEKGLAESPSSAEAAYDREWALSIMERALAALRKEFEEGARRGPFDLVLKFFQPGEPPSYDDAARQSAMTLAQFKAFLHRARTRFRDLVRQQVAHTVQHPRDTDGEIADLMRTLKS